MKTNRCPPTPAPALVVAGTATSSFAPRTIPSRRVWRPRRPGWGSHSPSHPVICILLSPSRAAGILICKEEEGQRQDGRERQRETEGEKEIEIKTEREAGEGDTGGCRVG